MCFWINVGLKSAHVTSTFSLSSYIFSAVLHSQRSHVSYQQERLGSVHMTVSFIIGPLKQEHLIHAEAQFMSHGFLLCRNFSLYNWRSSSYSAGLLAINHILSGNVKKKKRVNYGSAIFDFRATEWKSTTEPLPVTSAHIQIFVCQLSNKVPEGHKLNPTIKCSRGNIFRSGHP